MGRKYTLNMLLTVFESEMISILMILLMLLFTISSSVIEDMTRYVRGFLELFMSSKL